MLKEVQEELVSVKGTLLESDPSKIPSKRFLAKIHLVADMAEYFQISLNQATTVVTEIEAELPRAFRPEMEDNLPSPKTCKCS